MPVVPRKESFVTSLLQSVRPSRQSFFLQRLPRPSCRRVRRRDLIQKNSDVHHQHFGHAVIATPNTIVLMPLPDRPFEGRLGIDLDLAHANLLAKKTVDRLDQAWDPTEGCKGIIAGMGCKSGSWSAGAFPPDFFAILAIDRLGLVSKESDFLLRKNSSRKRYPCSSNVLCCSALKRMTICLFS